MSTATSTGSGQKSPVSAITPSIEASTAACDDQHAAHRAIPAKPIPPGQMWPLEFLHSRCGYGTRARAAAIKAGLPVYKWQKRAWIYTTELIDFLRRHGKPQEPAKNPGSVSDFTAGQKES